LSAGLNDLNLSYVKVPVQHPSCHLCPRDLPMIMRYVVSALNASLVGSTNLFATCAQEHLSTIVVLQIMFSLQESSANRVGEPRLL